MRKLSLLLLVMLTPMASAFAADGLLVYSERKEPLFAPILEMYTKQTGIEVRYVTDAAAVLTERLIAEGERTEADLLVAVDAGSLWHAAERGALASIDSAPLKATVAANLRDPHGRWFAITARARTIVYAPERVAAKELGSYEDLADPRWKGRLCLRSSKKVYNQSLVATMIARLGEAKTEGIVRGWVANLAAPPFADDTLLINAIAAGQCDVGIVNTYYFGRALKADPKLTVKLHWANQDSSGVHVNISGAGVVAHSKHKAEAQRLLEWLLAPEAQAAFAKLDFEFPLNAKVAADPLVASWGSYRGDVMNLVEAGRGQAAAVKLMDRAGYQ